MVSPSACRWSGCRVPACVPLCSHSLLFFTYAIPTRRCSWSSAKYVPAPHTSAPRYPPRAPRPFPHCPAALLHPVSPTPTHFAPVATPSKHAWKTRTPVRMHAPVCLHTHVPSHPRTQQLLTSHTSATSHGPHAPPRALQPALPPCPHRPTNSDPLAILAKHARDRHAHTHACTHPCIYPTTYPCGRGDRSR